SAGRKREKLLLRDAGLGKGRIQGAKRRFPTLVRELKGPPVNPDAAPGAGVAMSADGLGGIHVHAAHEPARLVGADRQQGELGFDKSAADLAEQSGVVGGVAGVIDGSVPRSED